MSDISSQLPDLLRKDLKAVICGTGADNNSGKFGEYYIDGGNRFWSTMVFHGVVPGDFLEGPHKSKRLLEHGIGFTHLNQKPSGHAKVLKEEEDFDVEELIKKVNTYQPQRLILNGKTTGEIFFGHGIKKYGYQNRDIGITKIYVLPSTSPRNRFKYWDMNIDKWDAFCEFIKKN
jgi:TDG/mug DNA glycosylase family protein